MSTFAVTDEKYVVVLFQTENRALVLGDILYQNLNKSLVGKS